MAKPKKQATPDKSTETEEIAVATVDLPETQDSYSYELTQTGQIFGDSSKAEPTDPIEGSTEAVQSDLHESNAMVAKEPENDSSTTTEPLNATAEDAAILDELLDDVTEETAVEYTLPIGISIVDSKDEKQTVKNGWGEPLPTKVVTITKSYLRETVAELLYIASLGGELDTTMLPTTRIPFMCKMLLPESKYQDYLERKGIPVHKDTQSYNQVLVKSFDRFDFFKTLVSVGKNGGLLKPRSEVVSGSKMMAQVLTHHPIADTFSTKVGVEKVKYTGAELGTFTIEELRAIAAWYGLPSVNSKSKCIAQIQEKQNA